jgi:outer membrane protein TolC
MRFLRKAIPACAALALAIVAGCATYRAQPVVPEESAAAFDGRTLDDPGLNSFIARSLPDPSREPAWNLAKLTLAALYFSPDLDVARAKWHASRAAVLTASQVPNPSLQFSVGYVQNPPSGDSPHTRELGVDIPIETAGKRGHRTTRAERLSDAARFDIRNVAWQVRSGVRARLLDWYATTARAAVLAKSVKVQESVAAMLANRLAVGAASSPEENQARITLVQDRVDLANAQRQIEQAKSRLAATIGLPAAALDGVRVSFDAFDRPHPRADYAILRREAVLNRADLLAALSEYAASEAALRLEIARQYPDIHLGAAYTFDMGTNKFTLGLSGVTLPVFNRNEGPIAEAKARRAEIAARFEALQAKVISEVDQAAQADDLARAQLALADSLIRAQRTQLEKLQRSFAAGETDRLALALATHTLHAAESAYVEATAQAQQALGLLEDATQRPLVGELVAIDPEVEPRGAKP